MFIPYQIYDLQVFSIILWIDARQSTGLLCLIKYRNSLSCLECLMLPTLALAKLIKTTWWTTKSYVISKSLCRRLMKWWVFCPHLFLQICLLLKITLWTSISLQCQSRLCRLWANLPSLSRIWLTAACWSYTWKSGMTSSSTRLRDLNALWVINHSLLSVACHHPFSLLWMLFFFDTESDI